MCALYSNFAHSIQIFLNRTRKFAQKFTKLMKNAVNCPKMKSQFGLFRVNEWTNIAISQVYEVIFSWFSHINSKKITKNIFVNFLIFEDFIWIKDIARNPNFCPIGLAHGHNLGPKGPKSCRDTLWECPWPIRDHYSTV